MPKHYTRKYGAKMGFQAGPKFARVNADIKYLKTVVNAEVHHHTVASANNFNSTGIVESLSKVVQGNGDVNRTGNSILPRFQSINVHVNKFIDVNAPEHETIRVIVFRYWGESTGDNPIVIINEILDSPDPLSYLNDDNVGSRGDRERRIEVHKSKLFTLDKVASTSRTWKWNIQINGPNKKVKDHMKFNNNTTQDPLSGGFYILFISDNASAMNESAFGYNAKLNFYDN